MTTLTVLLMAGCGRHDTPPTGPTPPPTLVTATAYILPNAVSRGDWAFGDEPVVVFEGERLRWVNADTITHVIVADSPDATDFHETKELPPTGEQSFIMNRLGTTSIHCAIHPNMTGILVVRERSTQALVAAASARRMRVPQIRFSDSERSSRSRAPAVLTGRGHGLGERPTGARTKGITPAGSRRRRWADQCGAGCGRLSWLPHRTCPGPRGPVRRPRRSGRSGGVSPDRERSSTWQA